MGKRKNLKYKVGDIVVWHREWFTAEMDMKVEIIEVISRTINDEEFNYIGTWYKRRDLVGIKNIFKDNELFRIGEQTQMSLF